MVLHSSGGSQPCYHAYYCRHLKLLSNRYAGVVCAMVIKLACAVLPVS